MLSWPCPITAPSIAPETVTVPPRLIADSVVAPSIVPVSAVSCVLVLLWLTAAEAPIALALMVLREPSAMAGALIRVPLSAMTEMSVAVLLASMVTSPEMVQISAICARQTSAGADMAPAMPTAESIFPARRISLLALAEYCEFVSKLYRKQY